jgi:hypothetical protein
MTKLLVLHQAAFILWLLMPVKEPAAAIPEAISVNNERWPERTATVVKPVVLTWEMLFKVVFEEKYSKKYKMKINVPDFDPTLQALNKKEVLITGFVIPTGIDNNSFVLSQNPYASCFFCGQGGVETVMTIKYKGKAPRYKTDDYITLKGIFELNSTNIEEFIYILNDAVEIKK